MMVALGPHTGGQLWSHRAQEGCVVDIREWALINGRVPHRNLPHAGHRVSIVLFTYSPTSGRNAGDAVEQATRFGLPVPAMPIAFTPIISELKFISMDMAPAPVAHRRLCESALSMEDNVRIPEQVDEADVTEQGASNIINSPHDSKPVNFLHMSLFMGFFYAALILGSLTSAYAYCVGNIDVRPRSVQSTDIM